MCLSRSLMLHMNCGLMINMHSGLHEQWTHSAVTGYVWAADVLSNETSRSLYDRFGPEGMKQQAGADSGRGNARQVRKRKRERIKEKSEKICGRLGDRTDMSRPNEPSQSKPPPRSSTPDGVLFLLCISGTALHWLTVRCLSKPADVFYFLL